MTTTPPRDRSQSVTAVVGTVAALGGLATLLGVVLLDDTAVPAGALALSSPAVVVAFILTAAAAEVIRVPLLHGEAREDLTFFEIVTAASILVLTPTWAVAAPLIGLAIAQIVMRKPVQKAVFNVGSYAVSTTVAVVTYSALAHDSSLLSLRGVLALVTAMLLFSVINTTLLSFVLHAALGIRKRDFLAEVWQLSLLMTVGSIGVGAIAVVIEPVSPALLPFTLLPVLSLWYAFRAASTRAEERERNRWLVTLSGVLTAEHEVADLLADASEAVRNAFGADLVLVDMPAEAVGTSTFPASDGVVPVTASRLPEGWATAVSVGLELGDGRRGSLLLGSAVGVRNPWTLRVTDAAVLTTVAASLSSAIRSAERHEALVRESSKMKAVVENASDGIAVISGAGFVRLWSPAMARITGVPEEIARIQLDGGHADAVQALITTATRNGAVVPTGDTPRSLTLVRNDGETRDVSVVVVAARTGRDAEPVAILTVHDVTAQARADRLKSDFVATISHELRTPITPIKGYAQLLLARGDAMTPERRTAAYELIAERADHLGRLVEDLLMASRASGTLGSKLTTSLEQHDLRTVVAAAVTSFPSLDGRLVVEQPDGPVPAFCDSVRTVQIVSNLVSNAQKYSAEGTPVVVRIPQAEFGDTHAVVQVVDQGCGLSEADRERVFERFYRVEDSMTMRTSGSGLGLYIARELAIAMGGDLTVTSQVGQGSTFTLRLPRTATTEISTPRPPEFRRTA